MSRFALSTLLVATLAMCSIVQLGFGQDDQTPTAAAPATAPGAQASVLPQDGDEASPSDIPVIQDQPIIGESANFDAPIGDGSFVSPGNEYGMNQNNVVPNYSNGGCCWNTCYTAPTCHSNCCTSNYSVNCYQVRPVFRARLFTGFRRRCCN